MISTLIAPRVVQTPLSGLIAARPQKPEPGVAAYAKAVGGREAEAAPKIKLEIKSANAMQREMASKEIYGMIERIRALKLLIKVDARAGLVEITQIAKDLRKALKTYRDASDPMAAAGARAELAAAERQARTAEAKQTEAAATQEADAADKAATAEAEAVVAEVEPEAVAEEAPQMPQGRSDAMADRSLMRDVRGMIHALREFMDKVRARENEPGGQKPDEDDWKEARKAMGELQADFGRISGELSHPMDIKV